MSDSINNNDQINKQYEILNYKKQILLFVIIIINNQENLRYSDLALKNPVC